MKYKAQFITVLLTLAFGLAACDSLVVPLEEAYANSGSPHREGLVVDQNGQPVKDVAVLGEATWIGGSQKYSTVTDAKGYFSIQARGQNLFVDFKKEGYMWDPDVPCKFNPPATSFYDYTSDNPPIYTIWKLKGIEPWVVLEKRYDSIEKDKIYTIDLIRGAISDSDSVGDLRFNIKRTATILSNGQADLSFSMEAIDGGFIESQVHAFHFEAPENGYGSKRNYSMSPFPDRFRPSFNGFYIKSRNGGVYGRFLIMVTLVRNGSPKDGTFEVIIESITNPTGSRNLEYTGDKASHPNNDGFW